MNKKLIATIAAAVMLSACGTKTVIVQQATTTDAPTTSVAQSGGVEGYFQAVLASFPNAVNIHGRNWIIEFGTVTCDAIDEGMSLTELLNMVPSTADGAMIGFMVRQAILNICPRNTWFLDAATNA